MKIKQSPDDFQVTELTELVPSAGEYGLYRLRKRNWTTNDAIAQMRKSWRVAADRVSIGGLKDRHARTTQHVTIWHGPRRGLAYKGLRFEYLGQVPRPLVSADIRANHFRITIRDLTAQAVALAKLRLPVMAAHGLPNYFDDQRFGSVANSQPAFVAKYWIQGDYETGLKLALAGDYEFETAESRGAKSILRRFWGDWPECRRRLPAGLARDLMQHLQAHPNDFRGACAAMRSEQSSLYLAAYQSACWNRVLAAWIDRHHSKELCLPLHLKLGDFPCPLRLEPQTCGQRTEVKLPLPCARLHYEDVIPSAPTDWPVVMREVLSSEGVELAQWRLPGLRRPFFSHGERSIWFVPRAVAATEHPDERHPGRRKLITSFELGRGSYATLVLKRLTQSWSPQEAALSAAGLAADKS